MINMVINNKIIVKVYKGNVQLSKIMKGNIVVWSATT